MKSISTKVFVFIFCLLSFNPAFAKKAGGLILKNADSMIRNDEKKIIELKGNVELIFKQQYLSADRATIYLEKKQLEAIGTVILATSTIYAEAEKLFFNYKTNQGVLYKGFIQSEKTSFSGEVIYKTGENDYEVQKANYTACTNCAPSWSFSGNKVDATFGDSAKIKNSFLKIKDIPVFWFPYFIVPLNNSRQSGLLSPIIESSNKGGSTIGINYYYVNSESTDSLYTLTNYETRGLKFSYNYRYALSPLDSGEIKFAFLNDKLFGEEFKDDYPAENYSGDPINRWYIEYSNRFELPQRYIQRTKLFWVSDSRYPFDFPVEIPYSGYPSLENKVSLTHNTEISSNFVEVVANRNLLKDNPLNTNSDAVHRFPEIQYGSNIRKIKNSNFYWQFNSQFSNFARPDRAYDNKVATGSQDTYDAGTDIIRAGHRLIVNPSIYYPIKTSKYVDILPKVSWKSNVYQFGVPGTTKEYLAINPNAVNEGNSAGQHQIETEISFQSRFSRIFDGDESDESESNSTENSNNTTKETKEILEKINQERIAYRHEIKPSITYIQTPFINRDNHSFLDGDTEDFLGNSLSINDADKLQFDYNDQFFDRRQIRLGVTNTVTKRLTSKSGGRSYSTPFFWDLYQSYDFKENDEPLSDLTSIANLTVGHFTLSKELHYYPYKSVTNSRFTLTYNSFTNSYISLGYESRFEVRRNKPLDTSTKIENIDIKMFYDTRDFRFGGKSSYNLVTNKWGGFELGFVAMPAGDCWRLGLTHSNPVSGVAVTKAVFEFLFDGKKWAGDDLKEKLDL